MAAVREASAAGIGGCIGRGCRNRVSSAYVDFHIGANHRWVLARPRRSDRCGGRSQRRPIPARAASQAGQLHGGLRGDRRRLPSQWLSGKLPHFPWVTRSGVDLNTEDPLNHPTTWNTDVSNSSATGTVHVRLFAMCVKIPTG
jgi:hypothetical protein